MKAETSKHFHGNSRPRSFHGRQMNRRSFIKLLTAVPIIGRLDRQRYQQRFGNLRAISDVDSGRLPFSPRRITVVNSGSVSSALNSQHTVLKSGQEDDASLPSEEKKGVILRITHTLSAYYNEQSASARWSNRIITQQGFCTTAYHGYGCGTAGCIQETNERTKTDNGVDWWVFLFPRGIDFGALNNSPVYLLVGQMFRVARPSLRLSAFELADALLRDLRGSLRIGGARRVANLSKASVAELLNSRMACNVV